MFRIISLYSLFSLFASSAFSVEWKTQGTGETVESRIAPPSGYTRITTEKGSFAQWLRSIPVFEKSHGVELYTGEKRNQPYLAAVLDIDVGTKDLQQCADSMIRLRAEYLKEMKQEDAICFKLTNGDAASWKKWAAGQRPKVSGKKLVWSQSAKASNTQESFRSYLNMVFMYAGTLSLNRDLPKIDAQSVIPGDTVIQGGSPGHAMLVMDVAQNKAGDRVMLLAQGFMPAQQMHIVTTPADPKMAWFPIQSNESIETPDWIFAQNSFHRFPENACFSNVKSK